LKDAGVKSAGKVALGTVKGDLHDIGKNLVGMMLEGGGFEVIDLGTDVDPEKFVEVVAKEHVQLIGLSALLTTTMSNMKTTIEALNAAGVRQQVKVIVGGAPVTEDFAVKIGADGFSSDASRAVAVAKSLLEVG
jgi:5-methyltetrahydrofolate--homocysteine methyltransferase